VIAATALAALRTWRPDLSPIEAEQVLIESAAGSRLDLTAAFAAVGMAAVTGAAPTPPPVGAPTAQPPPRPPAKPRLVTPKLTVSVSSLRSGKRTLTARARNRPRGARLSITVYAKRTRGALRRVASRARASATVRVRVRSWRRVTAKFTDTTGQRLTSRTSTVNARR
jgi:hypothetical protein